MNGMTLCAGCLDGKTMIEMNNLAVGYFPSEGLEVAVYPPPVPEPQPQNQPRLNEQPVPVMVEQASGTNF